MQWIPSTVKASLSGGGGGEHNKENKERRDRGEIPQPSSSSRLLCPALQPPPDRCLPRTQAELLPSTSVPWRATCSPRHTATACPALKMHRPVPTEKLWCQRLRFGHRISVKDTKTPWLNEVKEVVKLKKKTKKNALIGTLIIKTKQTSKVIDKNCWAGRYSFLLKLTLQQNFWQVRERTYTTVAKWLRCCHQLALVLLRIKFFSTHFLKWLTKARHFGCL